MLNSFHLFIFHSSQVSSSAANHPSPSLSSRSAQSTQSSSLVINLERPGDHLDSRGNSLDSRASRSSEDSSVGRHMLTERPPPLPSRGGGVPRRSRRREHSIPRKVDVVSQQDDSLSVTSTSQANPSSPRLSISSTLSAAASSTGSPRRHSNPSAVLHRVENSDSHIMDSLSINTNLGNSINSTSPQHTEFYNLSSPNMKVRVSKSPVVTRNPNKVGRAEFLMSLSQSGVKSPTSPSLSTHSSILGDQGDQSWDLAASKPITEDDHQDALDYLDAVARASQQKYGFQPNQQGSIDRRWGKTNRQMIGSDQSTASGIESPSAGGGNARKIGYVNLPNSSQSTSKGAALSPPRTINHGRQRSAPEAMLDISSLENASFTSQSSNEDHSLIPPPLAPKHSRQHSADESGRPGFLDLDPSVQYRPKSAGSKSEGATKSEDSALASPSRWDESGGRSPAEREAARRQLKGFSSPEEAVGGSVGGSVADWIGSASCEDLSDHMRTVIYDHSDSDFHDQGNTYDEIDSNPVDGDRDQVSSSVGSSTSHQTSEKPPLPFTGLKKFQSSTDYSRDRSKSFGYINVPNAAPANNSNNTKPQSTAPSAHLIRKMVNARNKQETLRKSLSNPNFLNLGSKEHLFTHKTSGIPGGNGRLAPVQKQKSRSFGSLFFPALRKALSRESLGGRGKSVSPERRNSNSRSTTPEGRRSRSFSFRRRNSEGGNSRASSLRRRDSFHGPGEMTIKGIRMTARSRSFRRVRGAKSVEVLTNSDNNAENGETTTTAATSTTTDTSNAITDSNATLRESSTRQISSPPTSARHSRSSAAADSVATRPSSSEAPESAVSTLVYTTLSFAHLPPVPHPDIPPPLPARRKSEPEGLPPELPAKETKPGSNHSVSNYMNLRGNSRRSSNNKDRESSIITERNAATNEDTEDIKPRKPRVSDIVAKIEDTTNNNHPTVKNSQEAGNNRASSGPPVALRGSSLKSKYGSSGKSGPEYKRPPPRPSSRTNSGGLGIKTEASSASENPTSNSGNRDESSRESKKSTTQVITPFQPIPFKRQTNGISSVRPPSKSSFSSSSKRTG